ncbi:MAG: tripartite tricarboxylate transporter substrate binding protein [Betaproteobacteria bacterium]|nr:tripartite tricarboxylate transporter substrate binding protein [Betaproteobacteria bacterium]
MRAAAQLRMTIAALAALATLVGAGNSAAQTYPSKPMRIIAPYAAGGAVDLMARYMCEKFTVSMGQPCVVENKPGAGGIIGFDMVAKAEPDGHTLVVAPNNLTIIPSLYAKVPYDTIKDFAPVALLSYSPIMIGVHSGFPPKSLPDLVAYARSNDGKVNFTTCGPASPQHLAGEMLGSQGGFKWSHIPYKGCGAAIADVLSGTVPVFISTVAHILPQVKAGKMRGLAVLSAQRTQFAPEYPTVGETFPHYVVDVWFGMLAPGKVPPAVLARLNAEVNKALQLPDLKDKLSTQFYEPLGGTAERFAEVIRNDVAKYGKVIRDVGIKSD